MCGSSVAHQAWTQQDKSSLRLGLIEPLYECDLLRTAAPEQLELSVALIRVDGASDCCYRSNGCTPHPHIDPFTVSALSALDVPVIERVDELRDLGMS
ncbi:hypothetical protein BIV23_37195 [Streptomyces monashensis]|uniref:Uncharacterized protein n=1 Tax=Streptomyces monashensis TaxID=1678012 RepID=A0A1S2PIN7_9ACTN|nr:hypothetical protein BIV23_37195 [Streptomyces monashensis]